MPTQSPDDAGWPSKDKKLFTDDGPGSGRRDIGGGSIESQFRHYVFGYMVAADVLIEAELSGSHPLIGEAAERWEVSVVFPILFLYRQHIELRLKWLVVCRSEADRETKRHIVQTAGHDLVALWDCARYLVFDHGAGATDEDVETAAQYIRELGEMDRSSCSFRYPISRDLEPTYPVSRVLDLRVLRDRMAALDRFFSRVEDSIDWLEEAAPIEQADMAYYFRFIPEPPEIWSPRGRT